MRVTGGEHRGRPLAAPAGRAVRPTADRVREALFNILAAGRTIDGFDLDGAAVVDVFAGTGAVGLEALSRGAAEAAFLDNDPAALAVIRANAARLGETARTAVINRDALHPGAAPRQYDLAFLDPPYGSGAAAAALAALAAGGWLAPDAAAVVETGAREPFVVPEGFALLAERRYGAARLLFLRRVG